MEERVLASNSHEWTRDAYLSQNTIGPFPPDPVSQPELTIQQASGDGFLVAEVSLADAKDSGSHELSALFTGNLGKSVGVLWIDSMTRQAGAAEEGHKLLSRQEPRPLAGWRSWRSC